MVVSFPLWPREMLDETAEIRRGAAGKKENKTLPPPSYIYILSFFFFYLISQLFFSPYIYIYLIESKVRRRTKSTKER